MPTYLDCRGQALIRKTARTTVGGSVKMIPNPVAVAEPG